MAAISSVFDFADYKKYLAARLAITGEGRGLRAKLAQSLGCQSAFVSQVLKGHPHFSLEHAILINGFLKHSTEESHFFMLLVQLGRAGTRALRDYYLFQIQEIHRKRQFVRERIQVRKSLTEMDQMTYYSSWIHAAVHIATSVPRFQTRDQIAARLGLASETVGRSLEFLSGAGLVTEERGRYKIGNARIHLGNESPMLPKHHANWRMRAIQSMDAPRADHLHYSAAISLSLSDFERVRGILLNMLERTEPILKESKEEEVFCLAMDFFRV